MGKSCVEWSCIVLRPALQLVDRGRGTAADDDQEVAAGIEFGVAVVDHGKRRAAGRFHQQAVLVEDVRSRRDGGAVGNDDALLGMLLRPLEGLLANLPCTE